MNWIFSKDRLPKDGEPCLICLQDADGGIYVEEDIYYWDSKLKMYFGISDDATDYAEDEIIAWMPLPNPPDEDREY